MKITVTSETYDKNDVLTEDMSFLMETKDPSHNVRIVGKSFFYENTNEGFDQAATFIEFLLNKGANFSVEQEIE